MVRFNKPLVEEHEVCERVLLFPVNDGDYLDLMAVHGGMRFQLLQVSRESLPKSTLDFIYTLNSKGKLLAPDLSMQQIVFLVSSSDFG